MNPSRKLLSLLAPLAFFAAALLWPHSARAACGNSMPYVFVNAVSTVDATTTNTNNTFLLGCANSVDHTQIGSAGIWASQILPTNTTNATFGGSTAYTFPVLVNFSSGITVGAQNSLLTTGPTALCGGTQPTNGKGLLLETSGGAQLLAVDLSGNAAFCGAYTGQISTTFQISTTGLVIAGTGFYDNGSSVANTTTCWGPTGADGHELQTCTTSNYPVSQTLNTTTSGSCTANTFCAVTTPLAVSGTHKGCWAENHYDGSTYTQSVVWSMVNDTSANRVLAIPQNYGVSTIAGSTAIAVNIFCSIQ